MSETERRLKDYLDSRQAGRERMCLEILSVQHGFSDVRPRLPKGGPDEARDIQALYEGELCFGAVGFVNGATDTQQHRKQIKKKFESDLGAAFRVKRDQTPNPKSFVFFTNVGLTPGIITSLQKLAYKNGVQHCDIFDRERIRVALDSNRGYAIRSRYLDLQLNDAEQKDFFSAWGDEINSAIGAKFQGIDRTTKRIQFLLEANIPLNQLGTKVKLDSSIWDSCQGEFFFQTYLSLRAHSDGLLGLTFGGGNARIVETLEEWEERGKGRTKNSQYSFGFSWIMPDTLEHSRYVENVDGLEYPTKLGGEVHEDEIRTSRSVSILEVDRTQFYFESLSEPFIERFQPTCNLLELDGCTILFDCNPEIADHIVEITLVAGGYELLKLSSSDFCPEPSNSNRLRFPTEAKLLVGSHKWVALRPSNSNSCFTLDLMGETPTRYDW
ncbi:hypothetical protein [uncultured Maricaulis sp.]|uniref:hypothetical protein n=1 Tax=uncultured Maricaulis sp. TaxID=174710 RepID=UPI0030DD1E55